MVLSAQVRDLLRCSVAVHDRHVAVHQNEAKQLLLSVNVFLNHLKSLHAIRSSLGLHRIILKLDQSFHGGQVELVVIYDQNIGQQFFHRAESRNYLRKLSFDGCFYSIDRTNLPLNSWHLHRLMPNLL
jgi:hypothetical protein